MLSQVFAKYRRSLQSIQEEPGVTAGPEAQDRREPHIDQFEEQENIRPATEAAFDRPVKKHKRSFTGRAKPSGPVLRDNRYAEEGQINKCCHGCKNPHLGNLSKGTCLPLLCPCSCTCWACDMLCSCGPDGDIDRERVHPLLRQYCKTWR